MTTIRDYREVDAAAVGQLIANTYGEYNLAFVASEERGPFLGPFQHAHSKDEGHREAIARAIQADIVFVAEDEMGEIVGILRGRKERLHSLFVRGDCQRQGIGRLLMQHFEQDCRRLGGHVVRLASTVEAVPFYQRLGYRRSTGVRAGWSFQGSGFHWQPMKKILEGDAGGQR